MDTNKKIRACASLSEEKHRAFKAECSLRGLDVGEALAMLVDHFLSGSEPPKRQAPIGILDKARAMLERGGRAAQSMEDAILGSYAIHHRNPE